MTDNDISAAFARVTALGAALPEVVVSTSYGTPSLKVRDKGLCRMKDTETLVLMCTAEDKEILLATAPDIYFETDHYKGWAPILVRLASISDEELALRLRQVWLTRAPKRLVERER